MYLDYKEMAVALFNATPYNAIFLFWRCFWRCKLPKAEESLKAGKGIQRLGH